MLHWIVNFLTRKLKQDLDKRTAWNLDIFDEPWDSNQLGFKGLGHTVLDNFSSDQMVIELTKISKMVQNYRRSQTKHRNAKKEYGWTKLERIKMGCIWVNLKNVGLRFFKFISVYIKMSFTQLENHSQLLCGCDFANERLLLCQFDV